MYYFSSTYGIGTIIENVDSLDICKPRIGTENSIGDDAALDLNYKGVSISCNQSFDRNILIELGGFDENFIGGYYEDADMGLRLKRSGYIFKIVCT